MSTATRKYDDFLDAVGEEVSPALESVDFEGARRLRRPS